VGLPQRNSSVLKQADLNKQKVKGSDPPSAVGGLKGSKKEKATMAQGKHQRINIRRSIKKGRLEGSKNKNGTPHTRS
jgi:hypothetical protein